MSATGRVRIFMRRRLYLASLDGFGGDVGGNQVLAGPLEPVELHSEQITPSVTHHARRPPNGSVRARELEADVQIVAHPELGRAIHEHTANADVDGGGRVGLDTVARTRLDLELHGRSQLAPDG